MEPVFTIHVVADTPIELNMWHGFSADRDIETDEVPVVTGREAIEICNTQFVWDWILVAADGFIRDAQGQPIGIYLRAFHKKDDREHGRYELLPDRSLTITLPTFAPAVFGDDEETCVYEFTLRNGTSI